RPLAWEANALPIELRSHSVAAAGGGPRATRAGGAAPDFLHFRNDREALQSDSQLAEAGDQPVEQVGQSRMGRLPVLRGGGQPVAHALLGVVGWRGVVAQLLQNRAERLFEHLAGLAVDRVDRLQLGLEFPPRLA